jgi:small subunit ribosomal protein S6e
MRANVHGGVRRAVVLSGGAGFKAKNKGERKRKVVRGDIITDEIVQINVKITDRPAGAAPIPKPAPKPKEEAAAQA